MRWLQFSFLGLFAVLFLLLGTNIASAHEVYVLEPGEIDTIVTGVASPNPFSAITANGTLFAFWAFVAMLVVGGVFFISISRKLEDILDPLLFRIKKPYGLLITRITAGLGLIASGYYGAFFGPELPLHATVGASQVFFLTQGLLALVGVFLILGFATRLAAGVGLAIFAVYAVQYGTYMITYVNYFGELLVVFFLGQHILSTDKDILAWHGVMGGISRFVEKYAFFFLRVTFGVSLIFASFYAKFMHSELAVQTVVQYNLTNYFPFDPLFVVLGAFIIEVLLGIFFIVGFEIRFSALFLIVFVTLSLIYFGEAVWPHIIFLGGSIALFVHGYDRYTIEGRFLKDAKHEPVL